MISDGIRMPLRTWPDAASRPTIGKGRMTVVIPTGGFVVIDLEMLSRANHRQIRRASSSHIGRSAPVHRTLVLSGASLRGAVLVRST